MSWQWYEDEEDKSISVPATSPQIYPDTIYKRIDSTSDSYRGDLSIVPLPQYYNFKKYNKIGYAAMMLLDALKSKFRLGQIIPYKEIAEIGKQLGFGERQTKTAISRLWAKGYVRKWAEGIWREGYLSRSKGKVGQYYGVHYELRK